MIENRKLGKEGNFTYRLYKASNDDEAFSQVEIFKNHYKNSVHIERWGNITEKDIKDFANIADDVTYLDLNLKVNDKFILVKEKTTLRMEDDKRIIKSKKLHKVLPKSKSWTEEQLRHLWRGLPDIVAKIVNKTSEEVEKERKRYIKDNPGFEYPKDCKKPRKNAKVIVEKKPWAQWELDILWNHPPKQTSLLLKAAGSVRTVYEIADKRKEFCLSKPDFIIPSCANFSKGDLPNRVEEVTQFSEIQNKEMQKVEIQKAEVRIEEEPSIEIRNAVRQPGFWDEKNTHILWNNPTEEVCRLLNKTPQAVYQQRIISLGKNPGFIIPKISGFVIKKKNTKYVFTYEGEEKIEKKEVAQTPVAITTQIQKERESEPQPLSAGESKQQQSQTNTQTVEANIQNIAGLLNQLEVKPKKITVGNITLEF